MGGICLFAPFTDRACAGGAAKYGRLLAESANLLLYGWLYLFPALSIGNAILRHKLYDIDIIIRRTLIYSILTAALAAIYFGGVVVAQSSCDRSPLPPTSPLSFRRWESPRCSIPLRHRIQNTIDRRFFRRKYDAQKTLEAFSIATRDEVDLDKLQAALVGVVQDTMQPTKIMLWIKEYESERRNPRNDDRVLLVQHSDYSHSVLRALCSC